MVSWWFLPMTCGKWLSSCHTDYSARKLRGAERLRRQCECARVEALVDMYSGLIHVTGSRSECCNGGL
jgi:hypothetical protein